jgi:hypothetical protein
MRYFLDTEFNGMGGDLISLALVCEDGRELYLAIQCRNPVPWVANNVIPIISCAGALPLMFVRTPEMIGMAIATFLERDPSPNIIADWPDDIAYLCKSIVVGPGKMVNIPSIKFELHRVDAYPTTLPGAIQHNALWDARALRHKVME